MELLLIESNDETLLHFLELGRTKTVVLVLDYVEVHFVFLLFSSPDGLLSSSRNAVVR